MNLHLAKERSDDACAQGERECKLHAAVPAPAVVLVGAAAGLAAAAAAAAAAIQSKTVTSV